MAESIQGYLVGIPSGVLLTVGTYLTCINLGRRK